MTETELELAALAAPVVTRYRFTVPYDPGDLIPGYVTRDGSVGVAPLRDVYGLAGACFAVNYGQGTTFITAKTGLTAAQPDLDLDIPSGTAILPLSFGIAFGAMTGTANHFFLQYGSSLVGAGTSSAATAGPTPFGSARGTACTARQAYSGSGTAPASPIELFDIDASTAASNGTPYTFTWTPPTLEPIVGPACVVGYGVSTTTALTFKAVLTYAEFPANYFT
jgi:hypothetical protein